MDRGFSHLIGSPRLAPYDLLLWQAVNDAIRSDPSWKNGNYKEQPARGVRFAFSALLVTTPERYNSTTRRAGRAAVDRQRATGISLRCQQLYPPVGGHDSARRASGVWWFDGTGGRRWARTNVLVIVSTTDRYVTPGPALQFSRALRAEVLELRGDCGHLAVLCEAGILASTVSAFLAK